ncbi:DUF362 domain-containing protein [Clostridium sp. SYSU_GA19001]|uniref:DUF362 domain-containing protein n=1 Tax=Clostridium caldaquaticum TaxID=2940653 RepID=UPI0020777381|nr:DUF362 domain-containing protein [Clostridium caldaquaticum]MCM8711468.1 DUF362 domain-containing protein [Clostridium caldaquaticum]
MNSVDKYSKVSIVQSEKAWAKELTYEDIKTMVKEAINLAGGFNNLIKPGDTVVIKPNLVSSKDSITGEPLDKEINGITTDWRITKAVVEMVRELNSIGKVYIMEGSAEYKTTDVMKNLNYSHEYIKDVDGFIGIEEDSGLWQDYNSPSLVKVNLPNGLLHKEYYLNKRYKEADVLISIACLKTHASAVVTGGIKNLSIGATPANIYGASQTDNSRMNMVPHDNKDGDLHKWIHDYYLCRPADFVILDGLQGYQNGSAPGYVNSSKEDRMNMRLVMAGRDAVAVDTIAALVMNWDPGSVGYLKYLSDSGAGVMDVTKIRVAGKAVDDVRKDFGTLKVPPSGAKRIGTKIAPRFRVKRFEVKENELNIDIAAFKDVKKVEYYIDDNICSEDLNFKNIHGSSKFKKLPQGEHKLKVCVYDSFLNRSEQTIPFFISY